MKEIDPNQPAFLRVPVKCLPTILSALRSNGFDQVATDVELFTKYYTDPELNAVREKWVERADEEKGRDGEVEFDSDATISESEENGEYVLGWVWIDGDEEDEDLS